MVMREIVLADIGHRNVMLSGQNFLDVTPCSLVEVPSKRVYVLNYQSMPYRIPDYSNLEA
jgi:hypothetical protein